MTKPISEMASQLARAALFFSETSEHPQVKYAFLEKAGVTNGVVETEAVAREIGAAILNHLTNSNLLMEHDATTADVLDNPKHGRMTR